MHSPTQVDDKTDDRLALVAGSSRTDACTTEVAPLHRRMKITVHHFNRVVWYAGSVGNTFRKEIVLMSTYLKIIAYYITKMATQYKDAKRCYINLKNRWDRRKTAENNYRKKAQAAKKVQL